MVSNLTLLPLAFMVLAVIFSPIGVSLNPACSVNPLQNSCLGAQNSIINNPACQVNPINNPSCAQSVQFLTNATVAFTPSGYSYNAAAQKQSCESVQIGGTTITQIPGLGTLSQLPVIGNVIDFMIGLGQYIQQNIINTFTGGITAPNIQTIYANNGIVQNCISASTSILLVVSFQGSDIILLFVGAVLTAAAVAVLSSVVLNAGGALIIFNAMSLALIYLILTAFGYATWATIPSPFGSFLYIINSLAFALGIVESVGGITS